MEKQTTLVNHFSHRHPLNFSQLHQEEEQDDIICSGCEISILGPFYHCSKPNCGFSLHKHCFKLPKQVRHESHPKHPLSLLPLPSYDTGEFLCNACGDFGTTFTYHCPVCQFDLHVRCACLPKIMRLEKEKHVHPLVLHYVLPSKKEDGEMVSLLCGLCEQSLPKICWAYFCEVCDYVTHLDCAINEEAEEDDSKKENRVESTVGRRI